jgi:hypothetical protein
MPFNAGYGLFSTLSCADVGGQLLLWCSPEPKNGCDTNPGLAGKPTALMQRPKNAPHPGATAFHALIKRTPLRQRVGASVKKTNHPVVSQDFVCEFAPVVGGVVVKPICLSRVIKAAVGFVDKTDGSSFAVKKPGL